MLAVISGVVPGDTVKSAWGPAPTAIASFASTPDGKLYVYGGDGGSGNVIVSALIS